MHPEILPQDVCIVGYARTPIGSFNGSLSSLTAVQLGTIAIKGALEKARISPNQVDEVIFGNVLSSGLGPAPAKQAALAANIPSSVSATSVNKVCASGMKAIMIGAGQIRLGYCDVVVVGGMESMSHCPYYLTAARHGYRMGHGEMLDGMIMDGLWDVFSDSHMGTLAEECAKKYNISREEQDEFAVQSYTRAINSTKENLFSDEIVPVKAPPSRSNPDPPLVAQDEQCFKCDIKKLRKLKPVFAETDGTITAGNASPISDGAAALVLVSGRYVLDHNCYVFGKLIGQADASQEPSQFSTSPSLAIPRAINDAKLKPEHIDVYEINEAFSVVTLANMKLLNLDQSVVNVYGGSVALGHPLGCSGARIVVTLLSILGNTKKTYGCASICNGGGGASAVVIQSIHSHPGSVNMVNDNNQKQPKTNPTETPIITPTPTAFVEFNHPGHFSFEKTILTLSVQNFPENENTTQHIHSSIQQQPVECAID